MPQGDHAGTRQRRDVHHCRRIEALCVSQRIAQDQPSFRIGVENLDGLAGHAGDDVARFGRIPIRHVLAGRNNADDIDRKTDLRHRLERAQDAAGAGHVVLHLIHLGCGFQRDAAGVEGDALPTSTTGLFFFAPP
jgi:hypothetical protein